MPGCNISLTLRLFIQDGPSTDFNREICMQIFITFAILQKFIILLNKVHIQIKLIKSTPQSYYQVCVLPGNVQVA